MSADVGPRLSDFDVLSAEAGVQGGVLYIVRKKDDPSAAPLRWRATRWPQTSEKLVTLRREAGLLHLDHAVKPEDVFFHPPSDTLYVTSKEVSQESLDSLIVRLKRDDLRFRENFLWRLIHRAASLCERFSELNTSSWRLIFDAKRIYVGPDSEILFDCFDPVLNSHKTIKTCPNHICKLALIFKNMQESKFTEEFKNFIEKMTHDDDDFICKMDSSVLLYHPTVLSHLDDKGDVFESTSNDSAFESDESLKNISAIKLSSPIRRAQLSPCLLALDLNLPGYVPRKVDKWSSRLDLAREPRDVSEDALSKVWLERLKNLQEREDAIESKERELAKKKLFDQIRSKISEKLNPIEGIDKKAIEVNPGITLQTAMNDKILRKEFQHEPESKTIALHCSRNPIMGRTRLQTLARRSSRPPNRCKRRSVPNYEDLDSSLSADSGDHSVLHTSSKLSAEIVPRPANISNLARRKVRFNNRNNPFAEYDSVSSTTFTFFDIENLDGYELPNLPDANKESLADRIAKFTYLDLEKMTDAKRAAMEEVRKSPPKVRPVLKTLSNGQINSTNISLKVSPLKRRGRKNKHPSPKLEKTSSQMNIYSANSESSGISVASFPFMGKIKDRRKSLPFSLGVKILDSKPKPPPPGAVNHEFVAPMTTRSKTLRNPLPSNNFSLPRSDTNVSNVSVSNKLNKSTADKENCPKTPSSKFVRDKKRMSILGFKTPFKFNL